MEFDPFAACLWDFHPKVAILPAETKLRFQQRVEELNEDLIGR